MDSQPVLELLYNVNKNINNIMGWTIHITTAQYNDNCCRCKVYVLLKTLQFFRVCLVKNAKGTGTYILYCGTIAPQYIYIYVDSTP
jgi:hypothetical protein